MFFVALNFTYQKVKIQLFFKTRYFSFFIQKNRFQK